MNRRRTTLLAAYTTALGAVLLVAPNQKLDAMGTDGWCYPVIGGCIDGILMYQGNCGRDQAAFCETDIYNCDGVRIYCGDVT